jgi:hypothetical protein
MSIREEVEKALTREVSNAQSNSHQRNYHTLCVRRDGTFFWMEEVSPSTRCIDPDAAEFAAFPELIQVGTGSADCNCKSCKGESEDDSDDPEPLYLLELMGQHLDEIEIGYFDDEE